MQYKKISNVDDYYMMEEVLSRRLRKINQSDPRPIAFREFGTLSLSILNISVFETQP